MSRGSKEISLNTPLASQQEILAAGDVLPYSGLDIEKFEADIRALNPHVRLCRCSARNREGMEIGRELLGSS